MSKKNGKERVQIVDANGDELDKLQTYGKYDTTSYENVDGTTTGALSSPLSADILYRIKAYSADCWVKIDSAPSAVTDEGMLMTQYDEITLQVDEGDKIAVIGGKINIVPRV